MVIGNFVGMCEVAAVPSIDILGGRAVRLRQGKTGTEEYFGNPIALARKYSKERFRRIHIVDLDAAFGRGSQIALLGKIASACPRLEIQWAGGIRSRNAARKAFALGASRVVLGTMLASSPDAVRKLSEEFGSSRVWASLDFSGKPPIMMVRGWEESALLGVRQAVALAEKCKVGGLIISSVDADGTGRGPSLPLLAQASRLTGLPLFLAGGVRCPNDVKAAIALGAKGAIIGRALYGGKFATEEWTCLRKG
jgi:phosphoribosylformimino-5-aminoimidazole carboxamide ribotide isomerase